MLLSEPLLLMQTLLRGQTLRERQRYWSRELLPLRSTIYPPRPVGHPSEEGN
jgi:hypothetical protein